MRQQDQTNKSWTDEDPSESSAITYVNSKVGPAFSAVIGVGVGSGAIGTIIGGGGNSGAIGTVIGSEAIGTVIGAGGISGSIGNVAGSRDFDRVLTIFVGAVVGAGLSGQGGTAGESIRVEKPTAVR